MTEEQKVNLVARNIGSITAQWGINLLGRAFKINPKIIDYTKVNTFLKELGLSSNQIALADRKYFLENWYTCQQILEIDWTDKKKYVYDRYDCDNFAETLSSHFSEIYGLNCVGKAWGRMERSNGPIGHVFSGILTADPLENLKLYYLEPQTDKWQEYKGQPIIINGVTYVVHWLSIH